MTLEELLALLPDNATGDIGADDMRTIVTDLYNAAHAPPDASAVPIVDAGALYDGTNVEDALQEIGAAAPMFVRAANDLTRTNVAVAAVDPELVITLAPLATYEIRVGINYDGPGTGAAGADFRFVFVPPGGSTWSWVFGMVGAQTSTAIAAGTTVNRQGFSGFTANCLVGAIAVANTMRVDVAGILVTDATGGPFSLAWSQAVADPGNTTRQAGSYMVAERLA